jgi:hypothetical protein
MRCQSCGRSTKINWGRADLILCESCFTAKGEKFLLDDGRASGDPWRETPDQGNGSPVSSGAEGIDHRFPGASPLSGSNTGGHESVCAFFPVAQSKLAVMYIVTFGLYAVYWFYKNWQYQEPYMGKQINPALRSIFYIFFTHSLFRRIKKAAVDKGSNPSWRADLWATFFVVLNIASNFADRISIEFDATAGADAVGLILVFVVVYPLYRAQGIINMINDDPQGALNRRFTAANYIFIVLGGAVWALAAAGILMSSYNR